MRATPLILLEFAVCRHLANVALPVLVASPGKKLTATPAYPGTSRGFPTANNTSAVIFPPLLLHSGVF
jgi:hypothetical protein